MFDDLTIEQIDKLEASFNDLFNRFKSKDLNKSDLEVCENIYKVAKIYLENETSKNDLYVGYYLLAKIANKYNYIPAFLDLGNIYETLEKDYLKASYWYKKGADLNDGPCARCYADLIMAKYIEGNEEEAFKYYLIAANSGIPEAQFVAGEFYRNNGNKEKALYYYRASSDNGYEYADVRIKQINEGLEDFNKENSENNSQKQTLNFKEVDLTNKKLYGEAWLNIASGDSIDKGLLMLEELCKKNYSEAYVALAMFTKDKETRIQYLKKAAEMGNDEGMWQYALTFNHSYIPDPNIIDDMLFEGYVLKAANKGSKDAMTEMGNINSRRKHYAEAFFWYYKAFALGNYNDPTSVDGIIKEWARNGVPTKYIKGSDAFTKEMNDLSINIIQGILGIRPSFTLEEIAEMAERGNELACYIGYEICLSKKDYKGAINFTECGARHEFAHSIKSLGDLYYEGYFGKEDLDKAAELYLDAMKKGDLDATIAFYSVKDREDEKIKAYYLALAHVRGASQAWSMLKEMALA